MSDFIDGGEDELRRRISERAYEIWETEGRPDGGDLEHWSRAETELRPVEHTAAVRVIETVVEELDARAKAQSRPASRVQSTR